MASILAVVAHPDDEVLGCGATLARHAARGDDVRVVALTDGVSARGKEEVQARRRRDAAQAAAAALGLREFRAFDFPDNQLDSRPLLEIVQAVEGAIRAAAPQVIYTHHAGDLNIDHAIVHRAVVTACRPLAGSPVRMIAAFEVLSSSEWASPSAATAFVPRLFVDVAATLERKIAALHCYAEEMRPYPHPRSEEGVRALAAYRGVSSGYEAAEAFDVVRMLSGGNEAA